MRQLLRHLYNGHTLRQALLLAAVVFLPGSGLALQTPESATYAVIITSLGGDPEYEKIIQGWGNDLHASLSRSGVGNDRLFWLAAKKQEGVYAECRRETIQKLFGDLAARARPQDVFLLFLMGHGSYDEYDYRINIAGPDVTAAELAEWLERIAAGRQVVVNMTSSSGASLTPLRRKGRVVITSTIAGQERNFSVFARYFIAALQEAASDADKNQAVSALEAFRYATREVARYYESLKRLATEHALLEDRGDGEGAKDPSAENGQGLLAASVALVRRDSGHPALDTPEARELRAQERKLEEAIEQLKFRKASMVAEEYAEQLEKLLIQLAETQQRLDNLEKQ